MSRFHSVVSRRDFMKGLGLAGVGLGAAAATAPIYHDLDEVLASPSAEWKRPWWVKRVDEPTVEIDWGLMKRIDQRTTTQAAYVNAQYKGVAEWKAVIAQGNANSAARLGTKGNTLRDNAFRTGADAFETPTRVWTHGTLLGPKVPTPEQRGLPKWTGTPEEATRMLRAAGVDYGAAHIGACELSGDERKLVFTHGKGEGGWSGGPPGSMGGGANDAYYIDHWPPPLIAGRKIEFVNADVGYETSEYIYLPDRPLWDIGVMIPMAKETWRTAPSVLASSGNISRYRMWTMSVLPGLLAFITGLGYHGYGYPYPCKAGGLVPSEASAVLGGISEMGRSSEIAINPEYGPVTGYYSILTDLPLEPNKPIDAGIFRFCHSCRKCANACPADAISQDSEPTWDIPNFGYKVPQMNMMPGKKLFWSDTHACREYFGLQGCLICRPICSFNVNTAAIAHEFVHATVSSTSLFNGFFFRMSEFFDYGLKDPDDWWNLQLPIWGTDSTLVARNGGYNK